MKNIWIFFLAIGIVMNHMALIAMEADDPKTIAEKSEEYNGLHHAIYKHNVAQVKEIVQARSLLSCGEVFSVLLLIVDITLEGKFKNDDLIDLMAVLKDRDDVKEHISIQKMKSYKDLLLQLYTTNNFVLFDSVIRYNLINVMEHILSNENISWEEATKNCRPIQSLEAATGQTFFKKALLANHIDLACVIFNNYVLENFIKRCPHDPCTSDCCRRWLVRDAFDSAEEMRLEKVIILFLTNRVLFCCLSKKKLRAYAKSSNNKTSQAAVSASAQKDLDCCNDCSIL